MSFLKSPLIWGIMLAIVLQGALRDGVTACMHGVNLILVCMLPVFFKEGGNVSTVSGTLNACTYVGSAFSTIGSCIG